MRGFITMVQRLLAVVGKESMEVAAADYSKNKEVIILGEYKDDTWLSEVASNPKPKKAAKSKVRS